VFVSREVGILHRDYFCVRSDLLTKFDTGPDIGHAVVDAVATRFNVGNVASD